MSDELDVSGVEDEERRLGELFASVQAPDSLRAAYGAGSAVRSGGFRPGRAVGRALIGRPGERRLRPLAAALVVPVAVLAIAGGAGLRAKLSGSSAGSAASPTGRISPAMAYDAARGEVVMFGGFGASGVLGDTWTWDGGGWTQQHPAESPVARSQAAMAFDPVSGRVILFGGSAPNQASPLDDTWSWDGSNWRQEHPAQRPGGNLGSLTDQMATDPERHQVVLAIAGTPAPQTWTWDGSDWSLHGGASAVAGAGQRLAWDEQLHSVVMLTDTSSCDRFNAVSGTVVGASGSASASVGMAAPAAPVPVAPRPAVTDAPPTPHAVVLPANPGIRTQPVPVPVPVHVQCLAAGVPSPAESGSIPAGSMGFACGGCPGAHMSAWDGNTWHDVTPRSAAPLVTTQLLSADPSGGGVLAWGGSSSWTVHSGAVAANPTSTALRLRNGAGMVEDPGHRVVVLFGGRVGLGFAADTWTWDGKAWTHRAGSVPPVPPMPTMHPIPLQLPAGPQNACQTSYSINHLSTTRVGSDAVQITVALSSISAATPPSPPLCTSPAVATLADSSGNPLPVQAEWPVSVGTSIFTWRNWCGDPHVVFQVASGNSTTGITFEMTPPCTDKAQPSTLVREALPSVP